MLDDQTFTERQVVVKQPDTCLNCHASMVAPLLKVADGNIQKSFAKIKLLSYTKAQPLAKYPVACIDCHDMQALKLRVTRPALMEGMRGNVKSFVSVETGLQCPGSG
jgi:nitrite reductase (cytochrome c-552)